jgi:hypothetical protein
VYDAARFRSAIGGAASSDVDDDEFMEVVDVALGTFADQLDDFDDSVGRSAELNDAERRLEYDEDVDVDNSGCCDGGGDADDGDDDDEADATVSANRRPRCTPEDSITTP